MTTSTRLSGVFDWIQCFVVNQEGLEADVERVKGRLKEGGLLWMSYPKARQLETDPNRDRLVSTVRAHGLQPVAQVSVDDVWSALRLKVVGGQGSTRARPWRALRLLGTKYQHV